MRRHEYLTDDPKPIQALLSTVRIGHLAYQREGKPEVLPYNFCILDGYLYFHGSPKTGLSEAANDQVKFLAYHEVAWIPSTWRHPHLACPATTYFTSLTISGKLQLVETVEEKARVLEAFMKKYQPDSSYTPLSDGRYEGPLNALCVVKLKASNPILKRKMGQHLTEKQRENVYVGLKNRAHPGDRQVAQAMAEANHQSCAEGWVESLTPQQLQSLTALLTDSYWASGRTESEQSRWNQMSEVVFAKCQGDDILAFARVSWVTPGTAYLADVIVAPQARGRGLGKKLIERIMNHPRVKTTQTVMLKTTDAQAFYEKFSFQEKYRDSASFMVRVLSC